MSEEPLVFKVISHDLTMLLEQGVIFPPEESRVQAEPVVTIVPPTEAAIALHDSVHEQEDDKGLISPSISLCDS